MPSIVGHVAVPLAIRIAHRIPRGVLLAGLVACMLPDADTIGMLFGVSRDGLFGHRGVTHSIGFVVAITWLAWLATARSSVRPEATIIIAVCALSHPLLDMFTNGGPGVMIGWPLSGSRVFARWRPIEVSPIGVGFFSVRGVTVVASELVWIVLPALLFAAIARSADRRGRRT